MKKCVAFMLAFALCFSMASCNSSETPDDSTNASNAASSNAPAAAGKAEDGGVALPLTDTPVTFTYYMPIDRTKAAPVLTNYSEIEGYQELERLTGVKIEWVHPSMGQESEQFNIMIASQDFPDIIYYDWASFQGGPKKAIDDEVIVRLNDLIEENAPNFKSKAVENSEIAKSMMTDEGDFFYFPYIHWNQLVVAGWSYLVRLDWLKDAGLELPETIADWDIMLKAFKDKGDLNGNGINDEYPLTSLMKDRDMLRWLANAWETDYDFYQKDQKVQFGPMDESFGEYLKHMNEWYEAGYIDPEFSSQDLTTYEAKIANGQAAVFLSGLDFGRYLLQMGEDAMTGMKYPVLNKGDKPIYNNGSLQGAQGQGAAISTACKDPVLAAKWLDFHYGQTGHMLLNFGIEGKSYTMVDGQPTFTDEIVKNPEGLSVELALVKYSMGGIAEAFFHDPLVRYARFGTFQQQRDTIDRTQDIDLSYKLPRITQTSEESNEYANIVSEVNTYLVESWAQFINGKKNVDADFDDFRNTLRQLGIERAIELRQLALERYNQR
ncbi:MAG: extracellular solute-binding protein [Clostridiales bacterium]|jgi:putative aldouronate transport system substrate-binding protein|nr:extracellular solute-binding protein [Clostridiales bacterium]